MKAGMVSMLLAAALGLSACQSTAIPGVIQADDAIRNQRAVLAQIASKPQQADVYFSADGQYNSQPVAGGYYRQVLGKTADGGWVVQDFYQDSQTKQIDPAVLFHPNGLRNFDNDVVDGPVVWYRPDGSMSQSATYARGKLQGWVSYYDEQGRGRNSVRFVDGESTGEQLAYDEQGRLQMRILLDDDKQLQQEFWYANGKLAVQWRQNGLNAWDEQGKALNETQASRLVDYLESRLYLIE